MRRTQVKHHNSNSADWKEIENVFVVSFGILTNSALSQGMLKLSYKYLN